MIDFTVFASGAGLRTLQAMGWIGLSLTSLNTANAAAFTVINNDDTGAGSFRQAVDDANANPGADTIVFGSVIGTIDINTPIIVKDDLTITGPGVDALTLNSKVTTQTDALFLNSGNNSNLSLIMSNLTFQQDPLSTRRLIRAKNEGQVTLQNARLLGNGNAIPAASGGAIAAVDTEVLIQNCVVDNFNTEFHGGAVFMQSVGTGATADLIVEDSLFTNNVTSGSSSSFGKHGGAIAAERSNKVSAMITIRNSSFISNSTLPANGDAHGGAIYAEDDISIDHGYFLQNYSRNSGGAIYLDSIGNAALDIRNSVFSENAASADGGAVYVFNDDLEITNTTFDSNSAAGRGGALGHQITGNINIVNSTFTANTATSVGGAIDSDPTAQDSTQINILNVTMFENRASEGGGVYNDLDYNAITIVNSLVTNNQASTSGTEIAGAASIDFSLIGNDPGDADQTALIELTPGNSIYDSDPLLAALANNGGQAAGRDSAVVIPTHAAQINSVLIGAGDASATNSSIALPPTDQRGDGFPRIKDGALEIGAIEYDASATTPTPVEPPSPVDGDDGTTVVSSGGGGGVLSWWSITLLLLMAVIRKTRDAIPY